MTRCFSRLRPIAILLITCATASYAADLAFEPVAGIADDGLRAGFVQNFETFNVGGLQNQNSWNGWAANIAVISDTPISGTKSARHTADGSGFLGFEVVSPLFTPAYGVVAVDVRLSSADVLYQLSFLGDQPTGNDGFHFCAAVQFVTDGTILALQAVDGAPVYMATTGTWTPRSPFQIAVEVLANGTLNIYKNAALIFTGTDITFAQTGTAGRLQRVLVWTDNALDLGGANLTFDNFTGVLSPGPGGCPGDVDCDRACTFADIDPFVQALRGPAAWPYACPWHTADVNGDGNVTFADIDPFIAVLGTTCP